MELIINTFGVSLGRDNSRFVVSSPDGRQYIPTESVESIQIYKGTQITSDAIMLAIEKEIDVLFIDKAGTPLGRVWSQRYGSVSTIRKGQLAFSFSGEAVPWIKDIICRKIENQQAMILMTRGESDRNRNIAERGIKRLEDYKTKIQGLEAEIVRDIASTLRGWEGQASRIYFSTINKFLPEEYRFEQRSQNPALDITNAFLNYGYGILYGKVESALIKAGIDPYIGILHRDDYNRPVLAYDVIELYRVWVDYVVYTILSQNIITDEFYSVRANGSFWLERLGRRIIIQSLNDYLEEIITVKDGLSRSRETQIFLYAQALAQTFKNFKV